MVPSGLLTRIDRCDRARQLRHVNRLLHAKKALQHFRASPFDRCAPHHAVRNATTLKHLCTTRPHAPPHETSSEGARGRRSRRAPARRERRKRLDRELAALGFDAERLEGDAALRGSAALATYRRFVIPKTAKGLRDALAPARARGGVAVDVVGLARQHLAEQADWLRNRDRSLEELPTRRTRTWLSFWTACGAARTSGRCCEPVETAGAGRVICCGTTPAPPTPAVLRAAMGCADLVRVERAPSTLETVVGVAARRVCGVGVRETTEPSVEAAVGHACRHWAHAAVFGHREFESRSTSRGGGTPSSRFPCTA